MTADDSIGGSEAGQAQELGGQVAGEQFVWRAVIARVGWIPGDPEKPFTGPSVQVFLACSPSDARKLDTKATWP